MSGEAPGRPRARLNIESIRKEAKQWLRALRGILSDSNTIAARTRLRCTFEPLPDKPTLRDVQHALARELGFAGWTELRHAISPQSETVQKALQQYEEKATALLDAYRLGTPDALERHYQFTWHRRAWTAMRTYIQLDLGKRPAYEGDDVPISIDDARYLIAIEHDFESWDDLQAFVDTLPDDAAVTASPVRVMASAGDQAASLVATREWAAVLETLATHPNAVLDANGQMTDAMLAQVARIPHLTVLNLGNCKQLSDEGIRHLAKLPHLRELDLSHTRVTDDGLKVLRELPALRSLNLVMTMVTDAGLTHLEHCHELERLHLMWTRTGNGAIRALAGKQKFTHLWSGNNVTDDGLRHLREIPTYASWRGEAARIGILQNEVEPNQLSIRGAITDRGLTYVRELNGLCVLHLEDVALSDSTRALEPLLTIPHLAKLGVDPKDSWMPTIARLPALRFLSMQDASITDDGFVSVSKSQTIEAIWGRRSHGLHARGFRALSTMPKLRNFSSSFLNVSDDALASLPDFPALRELMPMDIPDAGYRHIGRCTDLEQLQLMYCRDTTDAATEHITGLSKLRQYFNSYTTITDRTPAILSQMDALERVSLVACNHLTNVGVCELARLPRLRELEISGNALTESVKVAFPSTVTVRYSH